MDDLVAEFLTETAESLEVLDVELVRFESDPNDSYTLNNIFRLVHTIKGTCGFLGLARLEGVAHAGETLLGKFRDGALEVTPEAVTLVLAAIDRIKSILVGLEDTGAEPPGDDTALINGLNALAEGKAAPAAPVAEPPKIGPNGEEWDPDLERFLRPGEVSLAALERAFRDTPVEEETAAEGAPQEMAAFAPPAPDFPEVEHEEEGQARRETGPATIRVNVEVLEQLMTMVSELVLTRNQLLQIQRQQGDSDFKAPLQRLSQITAELQDRVMKARMQPVGNAWRKLPRIVRDICRETGKRIELQLDGESTELDRQVLELIRDPLTHMVRNSADHGVEAPGARAAAGKSETGTIRLAAQHEGGHIIIEVSDDGAGLNTERIRQKAIEKGLVTAAEAATLPDAHVHRFIFAPGFSTASQVTNLSGRGVGMDVVKTNIEQIGGSIELSSQEGQGASFRIKIPLTLAIVSALIVGAGGQRFVMPQSAVLELVGVGEGEQKIETINRTPVLRLRDRLLPLVDLTEVLGLPGVEQTQEDRYVVVMQAGAMRFGVVVDAVHDSEEIVVKPLASLVRAAPVLSGATILGDGSVVVILDPNGLASALGASGAAVSDDAEATRMSENRESLVLFAAGDSTLKAAPLNLVTRLEDAPVETIEWADGRALLQYRGALMPLVHVAGAHAFKREGRQPILVFSGGARPFGLAVDEIVDIAHERYDVELSTERPGILGAAVVRGRVVELIDVSAYLHEVTTTWIDKRVDQAKRGRVLLVEANDFCRNLLTPLLTAAGYETWTAHTADEALMLCEAEGGFDAILADVDGDPDGAAALATALADELAIPSPVYALSDRRRESDAFAGCVQKSDRSQLLAAIDQAVRQRGRAA